MYKEQILIVLYLAAIAWRLVFLLILHWGISFIIKIDTTPRDPESSVMYVVITFKGFDIYLVVFFKKCSLQADR